MNGVSGHHTEAAQGAAAAEFASERVDASR